MLYLSVDEDSSFFFYVPAFCALKEIEGKTMTTASDTLEGPWLTHTVDAKKNHATIRSIRVHASLRTSEKQATSRTILPIGPLETSPC